MEKILEYQDASPLLKDVEALRQKVDEDGFACFRGLIPREAVLELRRLVLQIFAHRGWIAAGTELMDGIVDASINQVEGYASNGADQATYQAVYRLQEFHRLAHHPAIVGLFEKLFDETVFVHPRNIARLMAPHKDAVHTPPHQDFIYVQGAKATYTCWFALGDCPKELGGLSVMRATHKVDILPVRSAEGAGGRTVILDDVDREWVEGGLETGDVVIFHSQTVHRSLPNKTRDHIRLSCDYRYQPLSLPVEEKSLEPHGSLMTWEEAYEGWSSEDLKYYWRDLDLHKVDFDWSILEIREQ
jgi:ectoine hydroxylase-related dioxygenase (phytanoyl-CoA dioxygenase family)